jgi:hypothetical protein
MVAVEGVIRACPQCGSSAFQALTDYSSPPWQIVACDACGFVFLRNPPEYKHLVSEFAWEKTRVAEVERRKARSLEQCSRVLAPGGAIYVRVPNYGSLNRRMLGAKWCGFRYPDHVNYFTTTSLGAMAGDCGLKLKLLNPIRLPLDDNINAVLLSEAGHA